MSHDGVPIEIIGPVSDSIAADLALSLERSVHEAGWDQPQRLFYGASTTAPIDLPPGAPSSVIAVLFGEKGLNPLVLDQMPGLVCAGIAAAMRREGVSPIPAGCVVLVTVFEIVTAPEEDEPTDNGQEARVLVMVDRLGQFYVVTRVLNEEPIVGVLPKSKLLVDLVVSGLRQLMMAVIDHDVAQAAAAAPSPASRRPADPRAN